MITPDIVIEEDQQPEDTAIVSTPSKRSPLLSILSSVDMLGLLSDLSPHLPAAHQSNIFRISKARDIMQQINQASQSSQQMLSSTQTPSHENMLTDVVGALAHNMRGSGLSQIGQISSLLSTVNTMRSSLSGLQNVLPAVQNQTNQLSDSHNESAATGDIAGTINSMLGGMDENKRQQFLNMAENVMSNMRNPSR